jgi:hypothetical protein
MASDIPEKSCAKRAPFDGIIVKVKNLQRQLAPDAASPPSAERLRYCGRGGSALATALLIAVCSVEIGRRGVPRMRIIAFLVYLAVVFLFVYAAERMATRQHRLRKGWMWATAFLGPVALLILMFLRRKAA